MTTEYTANFALAKPDFRSGPWHDQVNTNADHIDALLYSALSGVGVETWANNTHYGLGISAMDGTDASIWMCNVPHTSAVSGTFAADRTAHPTYWVRLLTGFAPRGQWLNSTNYFPYDLVYDAARGIMALCESQHTSNPSGNIKDDAAYWAFLIDMSGSTLATAVAVTYSNSSSGIPPTNVQGAIDYIQTEIVSLNNVNITQGNNITSLQSSDSSQTSTLTAHDTRLTAVEGVNTTQNTNITNLQGRMTAVEATLASGSFFPSGTTMLFYQSAAPTGWTKITTQNDKAIRVVSGAGGVFGGTNAFSTVMAQTVVGNTTLNVSQIPPHQHNVPNVPTAIVYNYYAGGNQGGPSGNVSTDPTGGGQPHNHTISLGIQYIDVILASKN